PALPSEELAAELAAVVKDLPQLDSLENDSLKRLIEEPAAAAHVLSQEAEQLELRAAELRRLAGEVHTQSVVGRLVEEMEQQAEAINLARAALLIAQLDDA